MQHSKSALIGTTLITLLLSSAAAFAGGTDEREIPPDQKVEPKPQPQHFCCSVVWAEDEERHGENCFAVGKESINQCGELLYCAGSYMKSGGVVSCK